MLDVSKNRDKSIDALRGIAMMLVVFGHTMSGSVINSQNTILYNIIWTIQMPLFILISGYVTKYSQPLETVSALASYIKRRSIAYLVPWIVWTIVIKGILSGQGNFLNIKWLFWNMDSGYWFLFSIWTICILFGISQYLSSILVSSSHRFKRCLTLIIFCVVGEALILAVGLYMGLNFAAIKLSAYYFPFYVVGYLYGSVHDKITNKTWFSILKDITLVVGLFAYIWLLTNYNFYKITDNIYGVVLRVTASLLGCIIASILLPSVINKSGKFSGLSSWVGMHTVEIYVVHYLFLNIIHISETFEITTLQGLHLVIINFILTFALTVILIMILNSNKICTLVLFGKYSSKR